ncbi:hypothetical protein Vretifemale_9230 [Volvox reticuliferus]|uniref:SAP domain-containing protein n=2 Tax=Volvox reticuliferus TaxID=1737510 RepID=A0A8J4CE53_9CHLO|nr:hypothetical protein Vretifemale_9230 [Volvox reticuliferus]
MEANKERVPSANSSPSNHHQIEEEMQQSDAGPASLPPSAIRKSCCVSQLPPELWSRIFVHLAASLEPPGLLRGPGVVAVDILRAGLTCQALLHASAAGIKALATAVPIYLHIPPLLLLPSSFPNHHQDYHHLPASAPTAVLATPATKAAFEGSPETKPAGEPDWDLIDGVISRPKSCTEAQLRNALRQLRQPSEGSRAEMMSRLRNLLGFAPAAVEPRPRSSPPPARLCVSLQQEREGRCGSAEAEPLSVRLAAALRDMVEAGNGLVGAALAEPSLAAMRRELCALYGNTEGLMEAHRTCLRQLPELRRRRAEERRRSLEVWRRREEEERAKEVGLSTKCRLS